MDYLELAITEAEKGLAEGGIPIGSILVHQGKVLGRGHNLSVQRGSSVLHGAMDAIENAGRLSAATYAQCTLYTTLSLSLSPCAMCSGAILPYKIPHVIVGENVTFTGEEELLRSRGVIVEVVQDARCIEVMKRFIAQHPSLWNEDIGV
jgi:creatinine deaminase